VHGNELLAQSVIGYDKTKKFGQSDHTVRNIKRAVRDLFGSDAKEAADHVMTELASYMVFDALIGNTDRHHENWGLKVQLASPSPTSHWITTAPSFDHASSLGRELLDAKRSELLADNGVAKYLSKARGGVFLDSAQRHGENLFVLVKNATAKYPEYFRSALNKVKSLDLAQLKIFSYNYHKSVPLRLPGNLLKLWC
jgi:hypothetical protein